MRTTKFSKIIFHSNILSINSWSFHGCTFTEIEWPSTVTIVPGSCFYSCPNLKKVILSDTTVSLFQRAFYQCDKLVEIDLKNVQYIGEYDFYGCTSLTILVLPPTLTTVGSSAFSLCTNLVVDSSKNENIAFIDNMLLTVKKTTLNAYYGTNTSLTIPEQCQVLDADVFLNSNLQSISFLTKESLTVRKNCFKSSKLTTITFPSCPIVLESNCFESCLSLTTVTFSSSSTLKIIPEYAFYNCAKLETISFLSGLISIEKYAFYKCSLLTDSS